MALDPKVTRKASRTHREAFCVCAVFHFDMVSGLRQAVRIVRKFCCQYSSAVAQYSTFLCLMPRWATVCFSSEADVTLDCVHTPARPDSKHRYERPRAGDEINGCCRDLLLCARPTRPSKGWWKTTATARPRTVSSSLVWRTRLVRSPNCASSFPAGGFRVQSSLLARVIRPVA